MAFRSQLRLAQVTGSFDRLHLADTRDYAEKKLAANMTGSDLNDVLAAFGGAISRIHGVAGGEYFNQSAGLFSHASVGLGTNGTEFQINDSSGDITFDNTTSDKDILFTVNDSDGGGADQEVFRVDGSAKSLLMAGTNKIEFSDSATFIHESADGVLDLVAATEIELNATTIDINGAVDVSGNLTVAGNLDVNGTVTTIDTVNLQVKDRIIELASNNPGNTPGFDLGLVMTRNANDVHTSTVSVDDGDEDHAANNTILGGVLVITDKAGNAQNFIFTDAQNGAKNTGNAVAVGDQVSANRKSPVAGVAVAITTGAGLNLDRHGILDQLATAIASANSAIKDSVFASEVPAKADGAQNITLSLDEAGTGSEAIAISGTAPAATIALAGGDMDGDTLFTLRAADDSTQTVAVNGTSADANFALVGGNLGTTAGNLATAIQSLSKFNAIAVGDNVVVMQLTPGTGGNTKSLTHDSAANVTVTGQGGGANQFNGGTTTIANLTVSAFAGSGTDAFPGNIAFTFDESADTLKLQMTSNTAADSSVAAINGAVLPVQIDQLNLSASGDTLSIDTTSRDFQINAVNNLGLIVGASDAVVIGSSDASTPGKIFLEEANSGGQGFFLQAPAGDITSADFGFVLPGSTGNVSQVLSVASIANTNTMTLGYANIGSARQELLSGSLNNDDTLARNTLLSTKGKSTTQDPTFKLEPVPDISQTDLKKALTVFVNGQLLLSGSPSDTNDSVCDYTMFDSAPVAATSTLTADDNTAAHGAAAGNTITFTSAGGVTQIIVFTSQANVGNSVQTDTELAGGSTTDVSGGGANVAIPAGAVGKCISLDGASAVGASQGNLLDEIREQLNKNTDPQITAAARSGNNMVLTQDTAGDAGNVPIAKTGLTNFTFGAFSGGVSAGFQDIKFAFALEEDDVIQMVIR